MQSLEKRLMALEHQSRATQYPAGLSHFYDTMTVLGGLRGGNALIARLDTDTATADDCQAIAALPGGQTRIRAVMTSLNRFYP